MKRGADLNEGPVGRHLVNLTIPMFLGIASMITASMIDVIYVGWIGTLELAAVSFTFPLTMALTTVSMGIGVGASSIIARIVGSGDFDRARRIATDSLVLVALLSVAIALAMFVWADDVLFALGAEADIEPLASRYLHIWVFGLPLFATTMVSATILRATGNARLPGAIMTGAAVLQVLAAPVLIFGIPGVWSGIGFAGAALGFVLSRGVTAVIIVRVLLRDRVVVAARVPFARVIESWREVMRIGIPSMASNLIGPVSMGVIVALLADYGHEVVAGFGVASRIEALATMILMALSSSTGPLIGQNWGAGNVRRIFEAQRLAYRFSFVWSVIAFVVLAGFGRPLIALINDDPGVIEATYWYLLLLPATYGFLGASMVAGSSFIAFGNPMPTLVMSVTRMFVLYVPMALLAERFWGYPGIFGAAGAANVLIGVVAMIWIRKLIRREWAKRQAAEADPHAPVVTPAA